MHLNPAFPLPVCQIVLAFCLASPAPLYLCETAYLDLDLVLLFGISLLPCNFVLLLNLTAYWFDLPACHWTCIAFWILYLCLDCSVKLVFAILCQSAFGSLPVCDRGPGLPFQNLHLSFLAVLHGWFLGLAGIPNLFSTNSILFV